MSQQAIIFAQQFNQWVGAWKRAHRRMDMTDREIASLIPVDQSVFSRWMRGKQVPKAPACFRIAAFFGLDVRDVLKAPGRPLDSIPVTLDTLLEMAKVESGSWPDRDRIMTALQRAQDLSFQSSKWGKNAMRYLSNEALTLQIKASLIADMVDAWDQEVALQQQFKNTQPNSLTTG